MGVFATRSPFRPNAIGLSCVKLEELRRDRDNGTVLLVSGADMTDGTPIFDIKPYLPLSDCRPEASSGFAGENENYSLEVIFPGNLLERVPEGKREALKKVLAGDPRPAYQNDPRRIYGFGFAGTEVRFSVDGETLYVRDILKET